MAKKAGSLFTTAYLLIMFVGYPLYMENGYLNIGEAKFRFFKYISLAAFFILAAAALLCLAKRVRAYFRQERVYLVNWDRVSAADLLVLLYATVVFLSYVFSDYKKEALWGAEGWYMGCATLLLLCGLYFLISRFWKGNLMIVCVALILTSALVFLLGICNRFSAYPFPAAGSQPAFLSTLGNINWYCGYLAVTAPVGITLFLFSESLCQKAAKDVLLAGYAVIVFMTGFSQGSSSIFLWFFALFFLLLWISLEEKKYLVRWFFLVFLWGISAQLVRIMRLIWPEGYLYDTDNLCGYFTESGLTLWIAIPALLVAFLMNGNGNGKGKKEKEYQKGRYKRVLRIGLVAGAAIFVVFWAVFAGIHTKWGVPFLEGNSFFTLNSDWGNGRGAAVLIGVKAFWEMPFLHKLFGAGPDCFAAYAYSVPELAVLLRENFGSARLTNAHCELLTGLVNTGIFGAALYVGIFVSFLKELLKKEKRQLMGVPFLVCMFCYLIHNMVSFAQVLNLPFLFLLMALYRRTSGD